MRYSAARRTYIAPRYHNTAAPRHQATHTTPETTEEIARTQIAGLLVNLELAQRHGLSTAVYDAKIAALLTQYPSLTPLTQEADA